MDAARRRLCLALVAFTVSAAPLATLDAGAADRAPGVPDPRYAIGIAHEATAGLLREALDGARERLARPRCQKLLDEFSDTRGRPLRDRLGEVGRTPESYLGLVIFYDGRPQARCEAGGTLAVTRVGSRLVYICPEALLEGMHRNPVWVEATLIHEMLHTLGLGENPPSSQEITSAVIRQCRG